MEETNNLIELDVFRNNCRACTKIVDITNMVNLFDSDKNVIAEIYTECTLLQISLTDSLPNYICNLCHEKLLGFNSFRISCIDAERFFRNKLTVKHELYTDDVHSEIIVESDCKDEMIPKTDKSKRRKIKLKLESRELKSEPKNILNKCDKPETEVKIEYSFNTDERVINKSTDSVLIGQSDSEETSKERGTTIIYKCDICNKKCFKKGCLIGHMRTHQGLRPYECNRCGRGFVKRYHLNEHLSFHNSVDNKIQYVCTFDRCGRSYPRKQSLTSHIRNIHKKDNQIDIERNYTCETCGKSFKRKDYLRTHKYTHTGMPLQCGLCPRKYSSKYQLTMHMNRHNDIKNHVCTICGLRKTTGFELRNHMKYHSDEKKYVCSFCSKPFATLSNMKSHERVVHRGIRSFQCPHCDRSFGKADTLKHHIMTHTGERPHECDICGKRFIQMTALYSHMKTHQKVK